MQLWPLMLALATGANAVTQSPTTNPAAGPSAQPVAAPSAVRSFFGILHLFFFLIKKINAM